VAQYPFQPIKEWATQGRLVLLLVVQMAAVAAAMHLQAVLVVPAVVPVAKVELVVLA
jgi:hypothetical protein